MFKILYKQTYDQALVRILDPYSWNLNTFIYFKCSVIIVEIILTS